MNDSTNPRTQAIAALAEPFFEKALFANDLACLKADVLDTGHVCGRSSCTRYPLWSKDLTWGQRL